MKKATKIITTDGLVSDDFMQFMKEIIERQKVHPLLSAEEIRDNLFKQIGRNLYAIYESVQMLERLEIDDAE